MNFEHAMTNKRAYFINVEKMTLHSHAMSKNSTETHKNRDFSSI